MVKLVLTVILLVLLTACSFGTPSPNKQLIKKAIALSMQETQQQLSEKLNLDFREFEINHLSIKQRKLMTVEGLPAFRIQGTYDLNLKLAKRTLAQPQKPFDVYLQLQKEGKTWRLLLPPLSNENTSIWHSYLLVMKIFAPT
ncbi:MAG: hypothetical protein HC836_00940 [Richelia sp. RM2_1_2]|nr:hypothetical protein [Richelia sp. SM2_1_7]NJM18866.1 hypothetical protein [Richelia sp. SM1_7_0]NJN06436.1 hypothetical protein [Richelia sp. RM1_1_1]NJO29121.1 hypothetical protein [Richelia sp. SL_2_1]NJO56984.1 hypothetical protein [Richelia sp. RM2_1_2]